MGIGSISGVRGERGEKLGRGETGDLEKLRNACSLGMKKNFEKATHKSDIKKRHKNVGLGKIPGVRVERVGKLDRGARVGLGKIPGLRERDGRS